jgi:NADH:ubiquinone oxidoreductase subunit 3 (subunit A)
MISECVCVYMCGREWVEVEHVGIIITSYIFQIVFVSYDYEVVFVFNMHVLLYLYMLLSESTIR